MSNDLDYRIAKLELQPGDMLVVKLNSRMSTDSMKRAKDFFEGEVPPGVKVIVIDHLVDLSVLSAQAITAAMTAQVDDPSLVHREPA